MDVQHLTKGVSYNLHVQTKERAAKMGKDMVYDPIHVAMKINAISCLTYEIIATWCMTDQIIERLQQNKHMQKRKTKVVKILEIFCIPPLSSSSSMGKSAISGGRSEALSSMSGIGSASAFISNS
ncbi:hypothetical protein KUTeg_005126 [Tegillarca granosa]|uniref:Uncharacterized protein n=1 Tax=Tegillarca granosa TaxID=220873 RepID=A0ABQ9FKU2_TEGGR|nr:hypothetical protein KUTeg_005126 [Tegillarca granosa]